MIVGITGKAGAGKDTVADFLVQEYGFVKVGLADPIKALLNARFGWEPEWWEDREWKESPDDCLGYDGGIVPFSPRSWAQWLGTEVGRTLEPGVWVRVAQERIHSILLKNLNTNIVIPDVRFNNEVALVDCLLEIKRDMARTVISHSSEAGISGDKITHSLNNAGSKEALYGRVEGVLKLPWGDM